MTDRPLTEEEFNAKVKMLMDDTPETTEERIKFLFKVNAQMVSDIYRVKAVQRFLEKRVRILAWGLFASVIPDILRVIGF